MKNILILLFVLLCIACNQQKVHTPADGFVINGNVSGFEENTMLYLNDTSVNKIIDSVTIIKGKFQFKGKVDQPKRVTVKTKYNGNSEEYKFMSFWVDNGIISFNGNFNDFSYSKVVGLPLHEIANKYSGLLEANYRKMNNLSKLYNNDEANNRKISNASKEINAINDSISIQFIKENPNNYVSLANMSYLVEKFPKVQLQALYNSLDKELKESKNGQVVNQFLSIEKIVEEGDKVVALTGKTLSGGEQDLMSIVKKNKYTILNFWASNCGFCRMQGEQYVDIYKEYKDKGLGIVTYSLDQKKEDWEKASKEDSISWVSISDLKGYKGITAMTYGVKGTPIRFLINQEGEIVKKDGGYRKDVKPFQDDLAALFDTPSK